jgi:Asp-tRNA(Asn)/Glu-tRNA(Gln) amidotransferase A subunit family amidase
VITVTADRALAQAARVDEEIAEGRYRGPLHGIPWGAKDLIDTAGTPTTYGAEMFRGRVPATNAAVVRMLEEAGAVLLAKLSLGALGLGNDWYGGETLNPWVIEERSSGSSSGSAAATAAGLVGFSLGTETLGSIVHPAYRCGCVGLRPTFGRVPRDGTMTLAWSLDKIGPLTRGVEDTMLVLQAIAGDTAEDSGIGAVPLAFTARRSVRGRRVGIVPQWMREAPATSHDLAVLEQLETLGLKPVELAFPEFPYQSLALIMFAEAAASLEPWLLNDSLRRVPREAVDGWPLLLKQARFLSAVDLIQAERLRTRIAAEFVRAFDAVDVMLVPSLRSEAIIATNFTGHPAITLPAGFIEISEARTDWAPHREAPRLPLEHPRKVPHGVTLIGRLFEEGALAEVAMALEGALRLGVLKPPSCQA